MKRISSILILLLLITACDDGRLTVDTIDFSDVPAQKCSDKDLIYKIKDNIMLFIEIPGTTFIEDQTLDGVPIEVPISGTVKVTYRKYASTVSANNICGAAPDVTPNLVEQWTATSGIIQITSTAIKTTNASNNSTKITGYTYNINFKNITFQKPNGSQQYDNFPFGNYTKPIANSLTFGFNQQVDKSTCSGSDKIYDFSGGEVFTLDVADFPTLFANEPTTTPRTVLINATNKLSYRLYSGVITNDYFCATTIPATPTLIQQWNAVDGIEATSGIIEVTTTTLGAGFQHTINLKKVTLKKGNSDFYLGDNYPFGTLITNP
ncbi:hypothetical protein [Flavobacterium sp. N1994]|uniref:hypothetical protein n=1 Tax=Flavobacterium sp. N1994 TaxID=2986827 RepID=UPI0022216248|nr:hypothetical protein [Flavobacterium sp. N1994]